MKGLPLPFEFDGKVTAALRRQTTAEFAVPCAEKVVHFEDLIGEEPKSVLDNINGSPSPPTSTSTLSSSHGGGGGGGAAVGVSAVPGNPWPLPENQETSSSNVGVVEVDLHDHRQRPEKSLDGAAAAGEMEDWETVLAESGQEQSILRWIMGDVEDPSMGLNRMLHGGGMAEDGELAAGYGGVDQSYLGFDSGNPVGQIGNLYQIPHKLSNEKIGFSSNPQPPPPLFSDDHHNHRHHKLSDLQNPMFSQSNPPETHPFDVKPQIFNPQFVINQNQSHPHRNPPFFVPLEHRHRHHQNHHLAPPQPKRHKPPFLNPPPNPLQLLQQTPSSIKKPSAIDEPELHHHHHHQAIIDQLFKAADSIQSGNNPILAQAILARLNHQLSPIGNPFERASFYFKESLQSLANSIVNNTNPQSNPIDSPFSLIFKIGAHKSFSEVSPFIQFTNFTCNQSLLETLDPFDHIHIVDFEIGFGTQWASFIQELALRNSPQSLKITAFFSPATHDHLELTLTRENLIHFASEMNVGFDFQIVNIDVLASASWGLPFRLSDHEAIAVNLPISVFSNHQIPTPLILRFIKNLAPKIIVSVDRGFEMTDLPFANRMVHALQSYSNLLESLDAVNMNLDVLQKIERFLIQPAIERVITGGYPFPAKSQHWRAQFLSAGFLPLTFSNFTESQAECVIKRTPVGGFHIEKRQSSLVLCWRQREVVAASAWRC